MRRRGEGSRSREGGKEMARRRWWRATVGEERRGGKGEGFQLDGANSDPEFILSISARWSGKELGAALSARRSLY